MGVDFLEITFEIEKRFGVVPDFADISAESTVGDLVDATWKQARGIPEGATATDLRLRRLQTHLDWELKPAEPVGPETSLARLIPLRDRRVMWPLLGQLLDARQWPELARPRWVVWWIGRSAVTLWFWVLLSPRFGADQAIALAVGLAFVLTPLVAILGYWVTRPLAVTFASVPTVADAARYVPLPDLALPPGVPTRYTREEIALGVREILCDVLFVPEELVVDSARLVDDLGMS